MKDKKNKFRFLSVLGIGLIFGMLGVVVIGQRMAKKVPAQDFAVTILENDVFGETEKEKERECLILWNDGENASEQARQELETVLKDMRVGYELRETSGISECRPDDYDKILLALADYQSLGEWLFTLTDWVRNGGNVMVCLPPETDVYSITTDNCWGIRARGTEGYWPEGMRTKSDLLLGGQAGDIPLPSTLLSSLVVTLQEDCIVHIVSADEKEIPLLWEREYDQGRVVFCNMGVPDKTNRGIYAAAYSLLGEICAYPVINGSAFYLDSFPSPALSGSNEMIYEAYGKEDNDFLREIWWPDMKELAAFYGVKYSGMLTENFDPRVEVPFSVNLNDENILYFGIALLKAGGELGISGYNTVPLTREPLWKGVPAYESCEAIEQGLKQALSFMETRFQQETVPVIAPPADVLSPEARQVLISRLPQIKAVAGVYTGEEIKIIQEFGVGADGLINTPRIVSGILGIQDQQLAALSELNLHFVSSYRQIIYELPEEIQRLSGWENARGIIENYMEWLFSSAPSIRRLTASDMAGAVQRFSYLDVKTEVGEDTVTFMLDGFQDEAWLLIRFNGKSPDAENIQGGRLQYMTGNLYLLQCQKKRICIPLGGA